MNLNHKHCKPCESGAPTLSEKEISRLAKEVASWEVVDNKRVVNTFTFKDFKSALVFVNKVGEIAEQEGHHPDISLFGWNKVKIEISTHSIGGLSENDFIVASKIDGIPL